MCINKSCVYQREKSLSLPFSCDGLLGRRCLQGTMAGGLSALTKSVGLVHRLGSLGLQNEKEEPGGV